MTSIAGKRIMCVHEPDVVACPTVVERSIQP